jgi:hypothetical protein
MHTTATRQLSDGEELVWAEFAEAPEGDRELDPRESASLRRRYALDDDVTPPASVPERE